MGQLEPDHSLTACYGHAKVAKRHADTCTLVDIYQRVGGLSEPPEPPQCIDLDEHYTLLYEVHTAVFAVHAIRIVAAFVFVTLVTRLCAGCIIMSHVPHVKFSHTLTLVIVQY